MTGRIATVIVTATLTGVLTAQQPQQPAVDVPLPDVTFTVDVNYVEVDAVVTREGKYRHIDVRGDYVLELEARSLIEPMRSVKRQLEIRVHE